MQRHCVSAVVPVRHDNWGGGLALRAQTTLPHLAAAFDELLLVDFNSQNGTLLSTLALPPLPRLRSVVVDRSLCSSLWPTPGGCGPDSFSTVLARNLGVERSSCDVVVSRDDLLSVGGVFALSAAAANLSEADGVHFQRASTWYGGVASAALRKVCGSGSL